MPVATYLRSLDPRLPRAVYVLELGALVNAFGSGVVLPFLLIYLHNVRGIPFGLAGSAAAVQSAAALASGFLGGTLSDRVGPKRVLLAALAVMTVAFALMPTIRTAWEAFAIYTLWGIGSGSFWPSQSALLAALTPATRRAPAYALQRLSMNVGVAVGGVVAGLIASVGNPQTFTVLFAINCVTFLGYMVVLAWVRAPALHEGRLGGSWHAVLRDRVFTRFTLLNAAFMTAAISLAVELLPAFGKNVTGISEREVGIVFALDALGVVLFQLPVVKLVEGRSRMRGLALMGLLWAASFARRVGCRLVGAGDCRVRDPRRRDARLRGRGVPARGDPGAAQRRPRAAAARRPLPRSLEHLVADRLDHRSRGRRLHPPAPAAPALADRGGGQSRLRGCGPRGSSGGCPSGFA